MKGEKVLYSFKSDEYSTPEDLFAQLDDEFHFTLDAAATKENRKCERYYSLEDSGLDHSWGGKWYSAILHTQRSASGWRKHSTRGRRITLLLSF